MKTEFTPGPWNSHRTAGHDIHGQSAVYVELDGKSIALVYDGDVNARLISAAPELFEALQECITEKGAIAERNHAYAMRRLEAISTIAVAAIQKAKG